MRKLILILFFGFVGCTSAQADTTFYDGSSIKLLTRQGEFKNKIRTDGTEMKFQLNLGKPIVKLLNLGFHVSGKAEFLKSTGVDDPNFSLINGNRNMAGAGIHTDAGTTVTAYFNGEYWEIEAENRNPIRWKLYSIMGLNHLNRYKKKRKTTLFTVGLEWKFTRSTSCEAKVSTGNNTAIYVNDFVSVGCTYTFFKDQ